MSGGLDGDARYKGKKGKRRVLDQDQEDHDQAELGHMFGVGDSGEEEEDEEEGMEEGSDEGSDEDEEEGDDMEDSDDEGAIENFKSSVKKSSEFSFDDKTDFAAYGEMEEEDSEDDDEDESNDDNNVEDNKESDTRDDNVSEDESSDAEEEEEEHADLPSQGLVARPTTDPNLKAKAVVAQLGVWDSLLEQRILLQKMLQKVNTFPQNLEDFVEEEQKEGMKKTAAALEEVVRAGEEVRRGLEGTGVEEEVKRGRLAKGADTKKMGRSAPPAAPNH